MTGEKADGKWTEGDDVAGALHFPLALASKVGGAGDRNSDSVRVTQSAAFPQAQVISTILHTAVAVHS